jgi:AraC family transcriptional regulator
LLRASYKGKIKQELQPRPRASAVHFPWIGALALRRTTPMIYLEMPPVWNPRFSAEFYARWGRESAVISAPAARVEYREYRQLLSIKAAFGGSETYFVDGRRKVVDDDTFLILNADRSYASKIDSIRPVHSFSIFFDAVLASTTVESITQRPETWLERGEGAATIEFSEQLHAHDRLVSPLLRYIRASVDEGLDDASWLDEQMTFLLGRMVRLHHNVLKREGLVPARKAPTRKELLRRLDLGVDFIHAHYRDPLDLKSVAAAAHLSRFYFLHLFKKVHGITPAQFIAQKRCATALSLLRKTSWTMTDIATHVGFGSRSTLFRKLKAAYGLSPDELRTLER